MRQNWPLVLGEAALVLLVIVVASTAFFKIVRRGFRIWRLVHNSAALILIMAFLHAARWGSDMQFAAVRIPTALLLVIALASYIHHKVVKKIIIRKNPFLVKDVTRETQDTWTIKLEPKNGKPFSYRPGQFLFITFVSENLSKEEHPFTISSSPTTDGYITITVKESGDYTSHIGEVKAGDVAYVEAPYGRFSFMNFDVSEIVFIAGGVGITPILSMLRYLGDKKSSMPVTLIWGNKTQAYIIRRGEIEEMKRNLPTLKIHHVLSMESEWEGETGFVDREKIERLSGPLLGRKDYFVCGPPVMMKKVIATLLKSDVPKRKIHFERFSL